MGTTAPIRRWPSLPSLPTTQIERYFLPQRTEVRIGHGHLEDPSGATHLTGLLKPGTSLVKSPELAFITGQVVPHRCGVLELIYDAQEIIAGLLGAFEFVQAIRAMNP